MQAYTFEDVWNLGDRQLRYLWLYNYIHQIIISLGMLFDTLATQMHILNLSQSNAGTSRDFKISMSSGAWNLPEPLIPRNPVSPALVRTLFVTTHIMVKLEAFAVEQVPPRISPLVYRRQIPRSKIHADEFVVDGQI